MRVNQNEAYNEIIFLKDVHDILKSPDESYINLHISEKVINKKTVKLLEDQTTNRNDSKKTKKGKAKSSFSFHNTKSLSGMYGLGYVFLTFLFIFLYLFLNYFYFDQTYQLMVQSIDSLIFFRKLNAIPPTLIALNRIAMREKILDNSLYQYPKTIERQTLLYHSYIDNLNELSQTTSRISSFLASSSALGNIELRNLIYGENGISVCDELFIKKYIPEDEKELCLGTLNGAFGKGLMNVFSSLYISLKQDIPLVEPVDYSDEIKFDVQKQEISASLLSDIGLDRILAEYFIMYAMFFLTDLLKVIFNDLLYGYMDSLQILDLATTVLIMILNIIIMIGLKRFLEKLYRNIMIVLLLIPYEKIFNDEQTNFLIKKFWKG